jgi:SAM-dependent methyltransferase
VLRRRVPFDAVADLYDRVRPGYPEVAVDDLVQLTSLPRRGRVLEIGPGTGQLTVSLAERGYHVTGVELGPHLAERANRNLASYPRASVVCGRFEDVELQSTDYDAVVAATSFHWLDPVTAYPRAASLLRPGGSLALLWNAHVDTDLGFFAASQQVYERVAPHLLGPAPLARGSDRAARAREIEESGCFGRVEVRATPWRADYSIRAYCDLLSSYSDHLELDPATRAQLFAELTTLSRQRFRGRVEKHYETVVFVAPVLEPSERAARA